MENETNIKKYELTYLLETAQMPKIDVYSNEPHRVYWIEDGNIYVYRDSELASPKLLGKSKDIRVLYCLPYEEEKYKRFNELYKSFDGRFDGPQVEIHILELSYLWHDKSVQKEIKNEKYPDLEGKRDWVENVLEK